MNSFKLALKKKSRLMETISYIKGQCNNLNRRTEDFIYYWKWLFLKLITYLLDSYLYLIIYQ